MATAAAERMRRMREGKRAAAAASPILYERPDWREFVNPVSLPRKAGCEPGQIGRVVLKELVDNALDAGGDVTLTGDSIGCAVYDNGPGIDPDQVPRLFAVNRPLVSSKLKRLPTRGMLGNGLRVVMGAVAAFGGSIRVTSRGCCYQLVTNITSGVTDVASKAPIPKDIEVIEGLAVEIRFPREMFSIEDYDFARQAITLSDMGNVYAGLPMRSWYGSAGLEATLAAAPKDLPRDVVMRDLFEQDNGPVDIGELGADALGGYYHKAQGIATIAGATIPFTVEAWIDCERAENREETDLDFNPMINRSPALAEIHYAADSSGLSVRGCGLAFTVPSAKRAIYTINISVITPYLRLMTDGKTPYLGDFKEAVTTAVKKAANEAYRYMIRPPARLSIKKAAHQVMKSAYLHASDNGALPAKARQIMYAARGEILRLTGLKGFTDTYFTQTLLPDYVNEHPEETKDWDVVYDARGNFVEPHTDRRIPLGTIQVRTYLGERPSLRPATELQADSLYPTAGPQNRYQNILFIEKEGFDELFEAVQLAERFDLAIMSTKGMSVVAARRILDGLADVVDNVFVLHDFDVSGFSIFGTLATDSRRYTFDNQVPVVDIGLRLVDVEAMGLETETVKVGNVEARRDTLAEHGATEEEIEFLAEPDDDDMCRRVELNAMTSRQLVDFVEEKLREHGVEKVVPDDDTLEAHARRLKEQVLTRKALQRLADDISRQAAEADLPEDLEERVREMLTEHSELSWDQALAMIIV